MQQLRPADVAGLLAAGPALLLDVREHVEFAHAAIRLEGTRTLHIPMNEVPARLAELDPAQPVLCVCHHGMRSAQVAMYLERAGFAAVYNLAGGIDAWSRQIDPTVPRY